MEIFTGKYRLVQVSLPGAGDYCEVYDRCGGYVGNIDYDSVKSCYDDKTGSYDYDKINEII